MVIVLKHDVAQEKIAHLVKWLEDKNLVVRTFCGQEQCVLGLIGDVTAIDMEMLQSLDIVESVANMTEPFKASNRKMHPDDTVIYSPFSPSDGKPLIGSGHFALIAGPCSVESREQIVLIAEQVKAAGATMLRGGAFKPRTSPYDFQGLGANGLDLLLEAKKTTGLPIVTELMDLRDIHLFEAVDVIQIGARNTQNYDLLKEIGKLPNTILLKRGLAGTINELLMSAEYIMASGNENVILCERGIRTYEYAHTRNTLDLSAVPILKKLTHLPVVVDPSHGTGRVDLVPSMSLAAVAAGADGIMIEVHNDPAKALCDGAQSLTPAQFNETARKIFKVREAVV